MDARFSVGDNIQALQSWSPNEMMGLGRNEVWEDVDVLQVVECYKGSKVDEHTSRDTIDRLLELHPWMGMFYDDSNKPYTGLLYEVQGKQWRAWRQEHQLRRRDVPQAVKAR